MEDLAEVITAAEFHPTDCSTLVTQTFTAMGYIYTFLGLQFFEGDDSTV